MPHDRGLNERGGTQRWLTVVALVAAVASVGSCRAHEERLVEPSGRVLRIGSGQLSATSPVNGLRQLAQIIAVEGLGRLADDGRVEPWVAESWKLAEDGRTLLVTLKSGVKFHDGSPATPQAVSALLPDAIRAVLGSADEDVDQIRPMDANAVAIGFRHPGPFLLESLEVPIRKPGPTIVATGAFAVSPNSTTTLRGNADYYLGRPRLDEVQIQTYPSVRAAWAELLRNRIDMLYEVGLDALDSLQSSTSVSLFTNVRHYQFVMVMNNASPALRSSTIRRGLNMAVDRSQLTRQALRDHGVPSSGPLSPRHWALQGEPQRAVFDPAQAASTLRGQRIKFTCLVPPDQIFERIALELKRQFAALGAEMELRAATQDQIFDAQSTGSFDAILSEAISGPTTLRLYQLWHSKGAMNPSKRFGNAAVDAALDRVRYAHNEAEYRRAVASMHDAFIEEPPAIFLTWSERVRAVAKRFSVAAPSEPGRDILSTLRLWTPREDERIANRN